MNMHIEQACISSRGQVLSEGDSYLPIPIILRDWDQRYHSEVRQGQSPDLASVSRDVYRTIIEA